MRLMYHQAKRHLHNWFIPHAGNNHHPHALRHKHLVAYSYAMLAAKVMLLGVLFLSFPSVAHFSTITEARIIELTNASRLGAGLPRLSINPVLSQAAQLKLQDMISQSYFAHESPSGVAPWEWFKQASYTYTYAGENLAMNFTQAEDAHQAWLDSPTHRANIMSDNYAEIGVAVGVGQIGDESVTLLVQFFGRTFVSPAVVSSQPSVSEVASAQAPEPASPSASPNRDESPGGPAISVGSPQAEAGPVLEPPTLEPPVPQDLSQPELHIGAQQSVTLEPAESSSFLASLISLVRKFYWVIVVFVGVLLLLKILIRINIQHKAVISHGALVMAIGLALLFLQLHFLEAISGPVLIF